MLPKFEYGHLYKFVVSIGMLLVGLAVVIPWLVLRESAPLLVPEEELRKLTPVAQAVMRRKQQDARWFVEAYRWISLALALAGGVCVFIGLRGWKDRQEVEDSKQVAERDVTLASLRQMTPQEVEEKREAEATELEAEAKAADSPTAPVSRDDLVLAIQRAQEGVWLGIRNAYPDGNLITDVRTGAGAVDGILYRREGGVIAVDVKYARTHRDFRKRIHEARGRLAEVVRDVPSWETRTVTGALVVVTPELPAEPPASDHVVRVLVVKESRLDDLDPAELRRAMEHGGVIA